MFLKIEVSSNSLYLYTLGLVKLSGCRQPNGGVPPQLTDSGVFCIKPREGGLWKMRFSTRPLKPLPVNKRLSQKLHFSRHDHVVPLFMSQNAILRSSEE